MEIQTGLNSIVRERVAKRIQQGAKSAEQAVELLISEGKISQDYIAYLGAGNTRTPDLRYTSEYGKLEMLMPRPNKGDGEQVLQLHDNAVGQLGERLNIPTRYLRELASGDEWQHELAATILNQHSTWTKRTRSLVRVVGNEVRGVLSDSYRRMNSVDILTAFIQSGAKQGAELADGFMDATRLYIEMLMPDTIAVPTAKNGIVEMAFGARLSTSDYGDGALELRAFLMQGICLNGMVRESVMRQVHLGARLPEHLSLSERTYRLDTQTQVSAVRDLTAGLFSKDAIRERAYEIQGASEIDVDIERELKGLARGKMTKDECKGVETLLMRNNPEDGIQGEATLWKLVQGVTAHSRELEPRRQRDLQEIAGELMQRVKS